MRLAPFLVLLALAALLAGAAPAGGAVPRPVELAEGWEFAFDPDAVAPPAAGPAAGWREVTVPHVFEPRPLDEAFPGPVGWYRLRFRGPATPEGWAWAVRFETVRRSSKVWLNGREIGRNDKPYTPFELPATGLLPGQENTLLVRVDNRRTPGFREGWWNWGGITREVTLEPRGRVDVRDIGLLSDVDCTERCTASVLFDAEVANRAPEDVRPEVTVRLRPPGGGKALTRTIRTRAIHPGEAARVRMTIPVPGRPELWSPDRPSLYGARVEAKLGSSVEAAHARRIGLRAVDVRDGRLWLNGRQLDVRGASIQEDVAGRGPALTDADVDGVVRDLKALGANVTRAHYLLDERLLERFDEEGILVWSQAPVYHRDVQLRTRAGYAREIDSVRRTVLGARNHPSVITHSVANELSPRADENAPTRRFLREARELTTDLDPTLPTSVDLLAWPGFPRQEAYGAFDLLGVNSYFGWYEGQGTRATGDLGDLEPFLRRLREQYPEQALVMTEFGAESTMDGPADVKETFAFQSRYVQQNLDIVERVGFLSGAIYWTLREFAVKPDWDGGALRDVPRDGIHNKGLITYAGDRKPAWAVARGAFEGTPLYRSPAPEELRAARTPPGAGLAVLPLAGVLALLIVLLGLAALLVRFGREVWQLGDRTEPPAPPVEEEPERHLRAVASRCRRPPRGGRRRVP